MILSRTAHCMYWLNRYLERAENQARFLETYFRSHVEGGHIESLDREDVYQLLNVSGDLQLFLQSGLGVSQSEVLNFLIFDRSAPNSLMSHLVKARDNAKHIRDSISADIWELINRMYWCVAAGPQTSGVPFGVFEQVKADYSRYLGVLETSLCRDELWDLSRLGQSIERADHITRMLDNFYLQNEEEENEDRPCIPLLHACDAYDMYRRTHQGIKLSHVSHFLVKNGIFPRSLLYCLTEAQSALGHLIELMGLEHRWESHISLNLIRTEVRSWTFPWSFREAESIRMHMDLIQEKLNQFDETLYQEFFYIKSFAVELSFENRDEPGFWGASQ